MTEVHHNFSPDDVFGALAEHKKGRTLPQSARDWFIANDVPPLNLVKTWAGYFDLVMHDDVVFNPSERGFEFGRYVKDHPSTPALTFVCWAEDGAAVDICAWQATTGKIATWLGNASMLGEDNLFGPRPDGGLLVHKDPIAWFRAKRSGVVILDKERARMKLRDAGLLIAANTEEAKALNAALRLPAPNIGVPA